jgi:hypothetical protein
MLIGYARVSTAEQTLELQTDTLTAAGCEKLFTEVAGRARTERPGLDQAIGFCRPGDMLVVWKLDRMGRSMAHLIDTIRQLEQRGVGFCSLTEQIDTTTPSGRLIFTRVRCAGRIRAGSHPRACAGGPEVGPRTGAYGRTTADISGNQSNSTSAAGE